MRAVVQSRLRVYLAERALNERRRPYTVREVAKGAGLSPTVVQGLMADDFKLIAKETIDKICTFLGCQVGDWLVWKRSSA